MSNQKSFNPNSLWFSRKACSEMLQVGLPKIDEYIDRGRGPLKSFMAGGKRMVYRDDLLEWFF